MAPANYLDQFAQPRLNRTEFLTIGYGTEVRQAESGPQTPIPQRQPIVRRYTTEIGQKLTSQILQTNGNEHDPRAGGGTCFGDSGGPVIRDGFVVARHELRLHEELPVPRRLPARRHPDRA